MKTAWLLLASLGLGSASVAAAETDAWLPVTLPQTEQRDLHSRHTGHDYRIFVSIPQQPPPPEGYPVLYVLDGNALFPMIALQANALESRPDPMQRASAVVVGVGYPGQALYDTALRARDYTPPAPEGQPADARHGGAEGFLAFLQTELKPLIERRYPINPQRQTLFGHSYGALFTLYTLINKPQAFQTYVAASPSLWWNERQLLRDSHRLLDSHSRLPARIWLTVGESEEPTDRGASPREQRQAERRMRSNLQALVEHLAPLEDQGLDLTFSIHPSADHGRNGTLTAAGVLDLALQPSPP